MQSQLLQRKRPLRSRLSRGTSASPSFHRRREGAAFCLHGRAAGNGATPPSHSVSNLAAELGVLVFHQTTRYASNGVSAATSVSIVLRTRKSETTQTHECSRAGVLPTLHGVVFAIFGAGPAVHCRRVAAPRPGRCHSSSDQPHALQARMPVLTDDDVVMHGDAERGRDLDDRFRHLDVRLRGRRIATGMIVHQDQCGRR